MDLRAYFNDTQGLGVLSTADAAGRVDSALYARPLVIDEETIAFISSPRLTYRNLQDNDYACYLFIEAGERYKGLRLDLCKIGEDDDSASVAEARRGRQTPSCVCGEEARLIYFHLERIRPLVGDQFGGEAPELHAGA